MLILVACQRPPGPLPLPKQREQIDAPDPPELGEFVDFSTSDWADYVVKDIDPGGDLRWTHEHPQLRFPVHGREGRRFVVDFVVHKEALDSTGPVALTVRINGSEIGTMGVQHDGEYHFDKPVNPDLLTGEGFTNVAIEVDKFLIAKDGTRHGYLIRRAGFQ